MKTKTTQHNAGECTPSSIVETVTRPDGHRALSQCMEQQLLQELELGNGSWADYVVWPVKDVLAVDLAAMTSK